MPPSVPNIDQLLAQFSSTLSLHVRPTWLSANLEALQNQARQVAAGPALFASLKFRILASDFTKSLQPHANLCFPVDIHDQHNTTMIGPIAVQVVDIQDMGTSKLDQLDKIEMVERGEMTKGKEVIRIVATEDVEGESETQRPRQQKEAKSGPHKVLVEDASGRSAYGIELKPLEGIKIGMSMGAKLVLRNVTVARGVLLLTPQNTQILGGKIEELHRGQLEYRKACLQSALEEIRSHQD
ncbi:hypothetical protein RUND412_006126 [Rhizina undulata]